MTDPALPEIAVTTPAKLHHVLGHDPPKLYEVTT
jgi:hypothetical protein